MLQDIINNAKEKMKKSCEVYERDMMGLRAGRANPKLLDRIMVDYYGTPTPIPQIGNISSPEPRLLVIAPWEAKMIPQVEKAIQKSDLGLNPSNDGKIIRLVFPELNEERRKDLTKVASKGAEDTKVAIRSIRRDAIEQIKKLKKNSEITEDDQHDAEEKMQKLTDKAIKDVDEIYARKEKEENELYYNYDFLEAHCTAKMLKCLKDEFECEYGGDGYAGYLFRTGAQDDKPGAEDVKDKVLKITKDSEGWYHYTFTDGGWRGENKIKVRVENGKVMVDEVERVNNEYAEAGNREFEEIESSMIDSLYFNENEPYLF